MAEEIDWQVCELCPARHPIEEMSSNGEIWVCPKCDAAWREHFASCDHVWKATHDEWGDEAHECAKCNGVVRDEDFPDAVGKPAPERTASVEH